MLAAPHMDAMRRRSDRTAKEEDMALRVDHADLARMRDQLLFDGAEASRKLSRFWVLGSFPSTSWPRRTPRSTGASTRS
jgi:hypothetical protein